MVFYEAAAPTGSSLGLRPLNGHVVHAAVNPAMHCVVAKRVKLSPRKLPTQPRARATVEAVLQACAQELVAEGYEATNINSIAKRAGVSVGSIYQYFPTKDALIGAVVRAHTRAMIEAFGAVPDTLAVAPLAEAVRWVASRAIAAYAVAPELRHVINSQVPRAHAFMQTADFDAWLADTAHAFLAAHRDALRPANLPLAVAILQTAVEAVVARFSSGDGGRPGEPELLDELCALMLGYLERPSIGG